MSRPCRNRDDILGFTRSNYVGRGTGGRYHRRIYKSLRLFPLAPLFPAVGSFEPLAAAVFPVASLTLAAQTSPHFASRPPNQGYSRPYLSQFFLFYLCPRFPFASFGPATISPSVSVRCTFGECTLFPLRAFSAETRITRLHKIKVEYTRRGTAQGVLSKHDAAQPPQRTGFPSRLVHGWTFQILQPVYRGAKRVSCYPSQLAQAL